jgi:tetratricopeptide (TPR) repeat protein
MTPTPQRVRDLFLAAVRRPVAEWDAYLAEACAGDDDLRRAARELLGAHVAAGSFLESPAPELDATRDLPQVTERPGAVIGPYKLLEQLGEGGFGVVFLAEQTQPVRRKVALKVLKAGMDTRQVVARFEAERQALAIMDHPNIAKVFDGGATPSGRPYLVMELVKGLPITEFCDQNHLTPRQRLELFLSVCQAVQHAHQKGIIHRDLKPGNVLVSRHDTTPVAKVIDFGVAKALGQELTDKTLFTGAAQMVGTPLYMSPEQAGMSDLDVDTRSDVYSLGVLLYELLTGTTPFTRERFKDAGYDEIRRIIREEDPPKPSTRLSDSTRTLPSISAQRQSEPARLSKFVRGELDWIVMKALEKDRERRYESANEFAADVQRYLAGEAVQAAPPSVGYRFRKFARRNKRALVTASLIGVALLLAVGSLGWVVRDREGGRVRTTAEVNQFLQRAESLYADNKLPEAVAEVQKARGVLEAGRGDANLEQRVRQWLTDLDTATKLEEIRLESFGEEDYNRVDTDYSRAFREYGIEAEALPEAEVTARVAASQIKFDLVLALGNWAEWLRTEKRPQDPARWQRLLAIARAADPEPWRQRLQVAVEARNVQTLRELADAADPGRLRPRTLAHLGDSLRVAGDAKAAVAFLRRAHRQHPGDFWINTALAISLAELKPPPWNEVIAFRRAALAVRPQSAMAHMLLAIALSKNDRLDEAIDEFRETIRLWPASAYAHNNLGLALEKKSKIDEAVAEYRKAIHIDPTFAAAHANLGSALHAREKLDEAAASLRTATELDANSAFAHHQLGCVLRDQNKLDQAIACFKKAIKNDPAYFKAHADLGNAFRLQGKLDEAMACCRKAIEIDKNDAMAHAYLGAVFHAQEKPDEAIEWYKKAIALDSKLSDAHHNLGTALVTQNKPDEAVSRFKTAVDLEPKVARFRHSLGLALIALKKPDEAVAAFREAIAIDSKYAEAHYNLGCCLTILNRLDEAADSFREAVLLNREYVEAHYNLGCILILQNKLDGATTSFREVIRLKHDHVLAHMNLGEVFRRQRKFGDAIAAYREVIHHNPENATAYFRLGIVLSGTGDPDGAIAAYEMVICLKPDYTDAHLNLGNALIDKGRYAEAVDTLREAIRLRPKEPFAYNSLGWVLGLMGRVEEAIASYEEAIRLKTDYIQPRSNLALILAVGPDPRFRDGKRAVDLLNTVEALGGKTAISRRAVGIAHYQAGNWKESLAALEEAMALAKGGSGYIWFCLAMAHQRLGHTAEAREWYDKAVGWMDKIKPADTTGELRRFRAEAAKLLGIAVEEAPPPRVKK